MSSRYEFAPSMRREFAAWLKTGSGAFDLGVGLSAESVENGGFWLRVSDPSPVPTYQEPHDLDLIAIGWPDGNPVIKCKGGVDPRPSAEALAKAIRQRDAAVSLNDDYRKEICQLKGELSKFDGVDHNWSKSGIKRLMAERNNLQKQIDDVRAAIETRHLTDGSSGL